MLHDFQQPGERRRGYSCADTCEQSRERGIYAPEYIRAHRINSAAYRGTGGDHARPQSAFERWWRRNAPK
jgi:hypothetical protein